MKIAVLGDGWLAEGLRFSYLSSQKFGVRVLEDGIQGDLEFFRQCDVLVVFIPFRRNLEDPWVYFRMMERVAEAVQDFGISRLVWAGSTSVYPVRGEVLDPTIKFDPVSERAQVLLDSERLFMSLAGVDVVALRIGGMIGPGRDSRKRAQRFIDEGRDVSELMVPLNIVRREFVCELVDRALCMSGKRVLNVVEDLFKTRFEYYRSFGIIGL